METFKKNNRNIILTLVVIVLAIIFVFVFSFQRSKDEEDSNLGEQLNSTDSLENAEILPVNLTAVHQGVNSANYQEYYFDPFDSGEPSTSSHLQLANIRKSQILLDNNSQIVPDISLQYLEPSKAESEQGIEKYSDGINIYKLKAPKEVNDQVCGEFGVYKNNKLLFSDLMCSSPLGNVIDWRIVNGKLALTYNKECEVGCNTEIYYDGKFISKEYQVKNPRYIFGFGGKIGFITSENIKEAEKTKIGINSKDRIYWNGNYITPFFDTIQTTSCCSSTGELLPAVFENGTLLFFAERDNKKYLTEVKLYY